MVAEQTITEKISQRRRQILVHSCLYYHMDTSIIDDFTFDKYAKELKELVNQYPKEAGMAALVNEFSEWDKDDCLSGYGLPFLGAYVIAKAEQLLEYEDKFHRPLISDER